MKTTLSYTCIGRLPSSLFLGLVLILMVSCAKKEEAVKAPMVFPVESLQIKSQPVEHSSMFVGKMDSRKTVSLHSRVDGHVVKIFKSPEDLVVKGQAILEIDPVQEKRNVESKFADFQSAEAEYHAQIRNLKALEAKRDGVSAQVEFAEKEYVRYSNLFTKGAVSHQLQESKERSLKVKKADALSLEAQIEAQKAAVNSAKKQMAKTKFDSEAQKEQLSYHQIKAPFGGTVGNIPVKVGDYVTPKDSLTSVSQAKPLEVYVQIPKDDATNLKHGMTIELLSSSNTVIGTSRIFYISPVVSSDSQSVLVKSLFDNDENVLRPAQNVNVKVMWGRKDGIVVPTKAIAVVGGQPFIYTVITDSNGKSKAQQIPVELGKIQGNNGIVIEKGLKNGDVLVVSGIQNLSDGVPVIEKEKS